MIFDYRLHVFRTVARTLNFHRAAEVLHISQPAVSRHVRELEKLIGADVFDRSARQIQLTAAGKIVFRYAMQITELYGALEVELSELMEELHGGFRLGASTTIAQYLVPALLAKFRKEHPSIQVHLTSLNSHDVEQKQLEHEVDLGLIEGERRLGTLRYSPWLKDTLILVTRPGNPLMKSSRLKIQHLKQLPWVRREPGSGTADITRRALAARGVDAESLNVTVHLSSSEAIKRYLMNSDTFAFLSRHAVLSELSRGELIEVEVEKLLIRRQLWIVERVGETPPLAKMFMNHFLRTPEGHLSRARRKPD